MKTLLNKLFDHHSLTQSEAHAALHQLGAGGVSAAHTAAFLTVFRMRPLTVAELAGFREALLDLCLDPALGTTDLVDIVGTGGDGKDTFNISTLASLVVAGAGVRVAKHGNFGVSSSCGSSDVLAYCGLELAPAPDRLRRQLEQAGICFLHAPAFHPALRHAGPVRRELGVRTFFNVLGPLVNPARPKTSILGVFSSEFQRLYHYLLQPGGGRYAVVHTLDGYDELSLTGPARVVSDYAGEEVLTPFSLNLPRYEQAELASGGSIEAAARQFQAVLNGDATPVQRDVVTANAALALRTHTPTLSWPDALTTARESLDSGAAKRAFAQVLAA